MTILRSAADVLADHVTLEVEYIDRMYLNVYQPRLQYEQGVVVFFRIHRGHQFASSALMDLVTKDFVAAIHGFVKTGGVDLVDFAKGQRKDDVAVAYLDGHDGSDAVLFVGRALERTPVFRTEKRRNPVTGASYAWIVRSTAMVNHFYFYCFDVNFGPFFIKFCTYFPYNAKLCINGNEWAKCQAARAAIGFEPLDNGFLSCENPKRLQQVCERLDAGRINGLLRKWLARLPHPFTAADRRAGYRHDISILQAEFSLTQVLDTAVTGTAVTPSLHVEYKHTRIKQYHKDGRALRTETTTNDTRDFGVGKRLENLPALRKIGFQANQRLLDVQPISHDCHIGEDVFHRICRPVNVNGQRAPALRFEDPRTQALLATMVIFRLLPNGFSNRDLREHLAPLLGRTADTMTAGQATYDLRRLRLHGLIERIPTTHSPTEAGVSIAGIHRPHVCDSLVCEAATTSVATVSGRGQTHPGRRESETAHCLPPSTGADAARPGSPSEVLEHSDWAGRDRGRARRRGVPRLRVTPPA